MGKTKFPRATACCASQLDRGEFEWGPCAKYIFGNCQSKRRRSALQVLFYKWIFSCSLFLVQHIKSKLTSHKKWVSAAYCNNLTTLPEQTGTNKQQTFWFPIKSSGVHIFKRNLNCAIPYPQEYLHKAVSNTRILCMLSAANVWRRDQSFCSCIETTVCWLTISACLSL